MARCHSPILVPWPAVSTCKRHLANSVTESLSSPAWLAGCPGWLGGLALSYRWPVGPDLADMGPGGQPDRWPVPGGGGWTCPAIHHDAPSRAVSGAAEGSTQAVLSGAAANMYVCHCGCGLVFAGCVLCWAMGALSVFGRVLHVICVSFCKLCVAYAGFAVRI